MRPLLLLLALAMACATDPDRGLAAGRYGYAASWAVAGFSIPATAIGTLDVTTVTGDQADYTFTLNEASGPVQGLPSTAFWTEANGFVFTAPSIGRAGATLMVPHFRADGSCDGRAVNTSTGQSSEMTCSWTRLP